MAKHNSQKTFAFREEMRIGAELANRLPKLRGATEVAKIIGISPQMLRRIECRALFKVQKRLREMHLQALLEE